MKALTVIHEAAVLSSVALGLAFCLSCDEQPSPKEVAKPASVEERPTTQPLPEASPQALATPPPWADRVSPDGGFPCDVDKVLAVSCRRCHFDPPENEAPFPLVKYEDIEKMRTGKPISKLMAQMVEADLMPPLDEPVEPKVTPLTPEQKETLMKWLGDGAPKSQEKCR